MTPARNRKSVRERSCHGGRRLSDGRRRLVTVPIPPSSMRIPANGHQFPPILELPAPHTATWHAAITRLTVD
ncbi:hypothetical protein E3N88_14416 [Mikania micrantha]|uniref:Uncharacterized protein n=1 Tax=Mikania micrantha TaxID=192012 RepID=A0A5N6P3Z3_9ASTR|nr:hypothetical protein E3N88_14416 [Mikania micrantha]